MIYVCDAIMGTGKSSAAINYINEHPKDKFIYITPYLDETKRIKKECYNINFVEPSDKLKQYNFKKSLHTIALIKKGYNITTTHQAFKNYTQDTLNSIKEQEYILIIDENVDILEASDVHADDLQLAVDAGYIADNNGIYSVVNAEYKGIALRELFTLLKSRELIRMNDNDRSLFYWALPQNLITSFKNVFILTYLFEGQSLHHFMKIYSIAYKHIGINKISKNTYRFGDYPGYTPEYTYNLKNMIHILDNEKMNKIGNDYYSLSMNWFKKNEHSVKQLKKNVSNCFNNIWRDIPSNKRLWGSHNGEYNKIKGKGYAKSFLIFNAKATNQYKDKICLAYTTNIFMNIDEKKFYNKHGLNVDEDIYALSIMIQWIWRSAIRDGKEIFLYLPSKRMRLLLSKWIQDISGGHKNE